jgi:glycosyltransferase involved in cell wall biosynthesis
MNVVVNAVNCRKGGVVQVAVGFIENTQKLKDINFIYLVSPEVYARLDSVIDVSKGEFHVLNYRPWFIPQIVALNWRINSILKMDYAYSISIGFPSLVIILKNEVGRWTDPWNIYSKCDLPYDNVRFLFRMQLKFLRPLKFFLVRRAKLVFTESAYVADHIAKRLNNGVKIKITSNFVNKFYQGRGSVLNFKSNELFVLMANHPHKDFEILIETLKILKENDYYFKIIISLDKNSRRGKSLLLRARNAGVENQLELIGFVSVLESEGYFLRSFMLILPTHLEVFSITPLEAGSFGIPSIVTDYSFNRSVYQENVVYYDPYSPEMLANNIILLKQDEAKYFEYARRAKKMSNINGENIIHGFIRELNTWHESTQA